MLSSEFPVNARCKRVMTPTTFPYPGPAAGFDDPFAMLLACHEQVLRKLDLLLRLPDHLANHGLDPAARLAAADVLRYFDQAGPEHHRDEERLVFPLLPDDPTVAALAAQHRSLDGAWAQIRASLHALEGPLAHGESLCWQNFARDYRAHIATEEAEVFPEARRRASAQTLERMGQDMARRRGVR